MGEIINNGIHECWLDKSFWLNGKLNTSGWWRAQIVRIKRGAWHCGVEKMQSKQASAAKIWKLLLKGI
jgi:hypothetical protein